MSGRPDRRRRVCSDDGPEEGPSYQRGYVRESVDLTRLRYRRPPPPVIQYVSTSSGGFRIMAATEERVSRGRLLKRAGVGAAALGAGSMLTASTAGAASSVSTACVGTGGCATNPGVSACGTACTACGCGVTVEGCCFCFENVFCAGLPTCTSSKACPPGWNCVAFDASNPCGAVQVCVPHCGACNHHTVCVCGASTKASKPGGPTAM